MRMPSRDDARLTTYRSVLDPRESDGTLTVVALSRYVLTLAPFTVPGETWFTCWDGPIVVAGNMRPSLVRFAFDKRPVEYFGPS